MPDPVSSSTFTQRVEEAVRTAALEQAIREEQDLVKSLASDHSCDNNWAGDHCVICAETQATALMVARLFNRSFNALVAERNQAELGWRQTKGDLAHSESERVTLQQMLTEARTSANEQWHRASGLQAERDRLRKVGQAVVDWADTRDGGPTWTKVLANLRAALNPQKFPEKSPDDCHGPDAQGLL